MKNKVVENMHLNNRVNCVQFVTSIHYRTIENLEKKQELCVPRTAKPIRLLSIYAGLIVQASAPDQCTCSMSWISMASLRHLRTFTYS